MRISTLVIGSAAILKESRFNPKAIIPICSLSLERKGAKVLAPRGLVEFEFSNVFACF